MGLSSYQLFRERIMMYAIIFVLIGNVHSYGYGAPDKACKSMDPTGHDAIPQATPSPFSISVTSDTYQPGHTITLHLNGSHGRSFMGFLIEARGADCGELLGNFLEMPDTIEMCGGHALSHSNADLKTSLTLRWNPPANGAGNVQFRATFVEELETYWINVPSLIISEHNDLLNGTTSPDSGLIICPTAIPPLSTAPTATLPPFPKGSRFSRFPECGLSVGCFHDCTESGCSFIFSWKDLGDQMEMVIKKLFHRGENKWIAIGFSADNKMGDDSVIECTSLNGETKVFQSYNVGKVNKMLTDPTLGITLLATSFENSVLQCKMAREITGKDDERAFDLRKDWKLMLTYGDAVRDYRKIPHDDALTWVTDEAIDLQRPMDVAAVQETYPLIKAHACIMVIAWLATAATGLVTARYTKSFWSNNTISGLKVWFWIHRSCMVLTLVFTTAGFIIAFVQAKGYSQISGPYYKQAHPVMGIVVTVMVYVNALMSNFRTPPGTKYRPLFNFVHFIIGTGAYILAVITIFLGSGLRKLNLPEITVYILAGYSGCVVIVYCLMELIPNSTIAERKAYTLEMTRIGEETTVNKLAKQPKNRDGLKILVLFFHIFVVWMLSIAIIYIIVVN